MINLRKEITRLPHACGAEHPSLVTSDRFEISDGCYGTTSLLELFGYERDWGRPAESDVDELRRVLSRAMAA